MASWCPKSVVEVEVLVDDSRTDANEGVELEFELDEKKEDRVSDGCLMSPSIRLLLTEEDTEEAVSVLLPLLILPLQRNDILLYLSVCLWLGVAFVEEIALLYIVGMNADCWRAYKVAGCCLLALLFANYSTIVAS